jgi:predicted nucleic acid-binding protein
LEDCSVLQLALQKKAVLLTGDNKLRNHANKCKVDAHGILWLMDLFLEEKLLNFATAADCLDRLMKSNPRLPNDECQRRKKIWAEGRGIIPPRPPKK